MKAELSFVVGPSETPSHQDDARFRKISDIDWAGRPLADEIIELDIGHPLPEESFRFAGAYWAVSQTNDGATAWFWLKRIVVDPDSVDWEGGFPGYIQYAQKHSWEVFGGYGRLGRQPASG